jgi:glutamate synthase domain-containing protein 3
MNGTVINTHGMDHRTINGLIREAGENVELEGAIGQRFIGAGMTGKDITVSGIPGNALGAYLNGGRITVLRDAQDAVGDTMNDGMIIVHGNIGDTAGYAMRGGRIYVRGNAGYRAGIHMKAYKEKVPVLIIGGRAGSFLGEYQAGGLIMVLGLDLDGEDPVGYFPCTGMHGGRMYIRSACEGIVFPEQVNVRKVNGREIQGIREYVEEYCRIFGLDAGAILESEFTEITPDTRNPYRQMYVVN